MRSIPVALLVAALLPAGCATKIPIRSLQPARVSLGSVRHLDLVQIEGRRSAQEAVLHELLGQARWQGYFTVQDATARGYEVRAMGRRVRLHGPRGRARALPEGRAGMRVDVYEWNAYREVRAVQRENEDGEAYTVDEPVLVGQVVLGVTLFDGSGRAILAEHEYVGRAAGLAEEVSRDAMVDAAARDAVAAFYHDVTPREVRVSVRLDEDDPGQEHILDAARAGRTAQAAAEARRYWRANPHNAAAAYNLAVLLDAMGEYEEALGLYDEALRLGWKDFYAGARAGCARRLAAARELHAGEPAAGGWPEDRPGPPAAPRY